jgi:uracil DNA glycosylase
VNLEIPKSWQAAVGEEFEKQYFKNLTRFVDEERQAFPSKIYPAEGEVFAALEFTPFDEVRVVLLGQDPYPGEGTDCAFQSHRRSANFQHRSETSSRNCKATSAFPRPTTVALRRGLNRAC